ncbi:MFS transporter [Streptomyces sp. NPDC047515]|uniref:MFS transporter n=1 Tax=Streptomyces sp. NPDC047515 TaxID=3155380 RepID=UPI0033F9B5D5
MGHFHAARVNFVGLSLLQVLWLQRVRGLTALQVGVQLLAEFGAFIAASVLAGILVRRLGPRVLITAGLLLAAFGAALFTQVEPDTAFAGYAAAFVLFGLGCGLANAPSTALAVGHVPPAARARPTAPSTPPARSAPSSAPASSPH